MTPRRLWTAAAAATVLLLCFPGITWGDPADELMKVGRTAFADGQFSLAISSFQRVVDEHPDAAAAQEASYLLGVSYYYTGRWSDCIDALSLLQQRYPASKLRTRAAYWSGAASLKLEDWSRALEGLTSFLADPDGASSWVPGAMVYEAIALEGLGRDGEASAVYQRVMEQSGSAASPQATEAAFRLAGLQMRAGKYASARDLYGRILLSGSSSPYVPDAVFFTGECELALGNLDEASRRYRTLLSLYPSSAYVEAASFRLVDIAWRRHSASALQMAGDFLDRFPTGSWRGNAHKLRGDIFYGRKQMKPAESEYVEATRDLPEGEDLQATWYSLGMTQVALGSPAEAAGSFAKAAEGASPALAEEASFQRALALSAAGRSTEAMEALRAFLREHPGSRHAEQAQRALATLQERAGDRDGARSSWDTLVKGFPSSDLLPEYLIRRGSASMAAGLLGPALDDFQDISRRYPGTAWSARGAYLVGYAYTLRGEYPRALPFFRSASQEATADSDRDRARLSAAVCLFDMGRFDQALGELTALRATVGPGGSVDAGASDPELHAGVLDLYRGRSLYRMGRLPEAVAVLTPAAEELAAEGSALGADAQYWKGWALLRLGRPADAYAAFLAVAKEYPQDPRRLEAIFRAGVCKTLIPDDEAAVALFDQLVSSPSGSGVPPSLLEQAMYEQEEALLRMGRTQQSQESLERLARRFPRSRLAAQAFYSRAERALAAKDYAGARAGFARVSRDFPRSPLAAQASYWSAEASLRGGDPRQALEAFWECIRQAGSRQGDPSIQDAAVAGFASALHVLDDADAARLYETRVRSAAGLSTDASAGVKLALAETLLPVDPAEAHALVEEVASSGPSEPYAGQASLLQGMYAASRSDWTTALDILGALESSRADEVGARAALQKGRTLESMGRTAEAVDQYLRTAYLFPGFPDRAAEALANAARLSRARGDSARALRIEQTLHDTYPAWTAPAAGN